MNRLKYQLNFLHVLKESKRTKRALIASPDDQLMVTVEYALNTLDGKKERVN